MAGTCPYHLRLQRVDVAAQLQGVGRGVTHGCPGAFGFILRDVHVPEFCGGSGGCKESGTSVQPVFPLPPPLSKLLCPAHGVRSLSPQTALEQWAVRSLVTQGGRGDIIPGLVPHHHGDPPELCPMGAS